jgi:organic radical activating enzyme
MLTRNYDVNLINGFISHCCRFKPIKFVAEEFDQLGHSYIDNNSEIVRARQDLSRGVQTPRCQECWDDENKNILSWRLIKQNYRHNEINMNLQLSALCNQSCYYCVPESSSTIAKYGSWINSKSAEVLSVPPYQNKLLIDFDTVTEFVKHIDKKFTVFQLSVSGGEPFLLDNFENELINLAEVFLAIDNNRKVAITISTNGNSKVDKIKYFYERINQLNLKDKIDVAVITSIENLEERAEYVRDGLDWKNFVENFKVHYSMADNLAVRLTVNPFTVVKITDFFKYFSAYESVKFHYNYPFQNFLRMQVLDQRFLPELQSLEQYVVSKGISEKFEAEFYKLLPLQLKNDRTNAVLFKKAVLNLDRIKNKNWRTVFPEYIDWFESIPVK